MAESPAAAAFRGNRAGTGGLTGKPKCGRYLSIHFAPMARAAGRQQEALILIAEIGVVTDQSAQEGFDSLPRSRRVLSGGRESPV